MFGISVGWSWRRIFVGLVILGAIGAVVFVPEVRSRALFFLGEAKEKMNVSTEREETMGGSQKVYVVSGDKHYHASRSCPRIKGKRSVPRSLEEARQVSGPCPECKPPR